MVKEEWEEGGWEGVGVGLGGGAAIVCGQCSFVNCTNKRLLVGLVNGLNWAGLGGKLKWHLMCSIDISSLAATATTKRSVGGRVGALV